MSIQVQDSYLIEQAVCMKFLYEKLKEYHQKNIYPFHMPGHKRNEEAVEFLPGLTEDITEIEGFDYLHHPTGILRQSQAAAAELYKADETFYCVNGSTGALLAAIAACTVPGGAVLMARNCHQSVYHSVCLGQLENYYVYPEFLSSYGINGAVLPGRVEEALSAHPRVQAVVITSPTYDGVVSSVGEIAEIVHGRGVPLIVDEAHGAHFPFHDYFPQSALEQGADVVVHSLHKTLPALTQTAILHVQGKLADRERIRRYMGMYQTSSPSYLLMGSIDGCVRNLQHGGKTFFEKYAERLERLRGRLSGLEYIQLAGDELYQREAVWDLDRSKLLLYVQAEGLGGHHLYELLLKKYGLQMEMEAKTYVLGMTSPADTKDGYERLCLALEDIERTWREEGRALKKPEGEPALKWQETLALTRKVLSISDAVARPQMLVPFEQSEGSIAGEFLHLYPPGVPLAVPGEEITQKLLDTVADCRDAGLEVRGLAGERGELISVCFK